MSKVLRFPGFNAFLVKTLSTIFVVTSGASCRQQQQGSSQVAVYGALQGRPQQDALEAIKSTVYLSTGCGGALVSDALVVTAAHCVPLGVAIMGKTQHRDGFATLDEANRKFEVVFSHRPLDQAAQRRKVIDYRLHENFHGSTYQSDRDSSGHKTILHDVALIRFEGGIPEGFAPAKLPGAEESVLRPVNVTLTGFGTSSVNSGALNALQVLSAQVTQPFYNALEAYVQSRPGEGICSGDSGSPVYLQANQVLVAGQPPRGAVFKLAGLVSRVAGSTAFKQGAGGLCDEAFVFSKVAAYADWFAQKTSTLMLTTQALRDAQACILTPDKEAECRIYGNSSVYFHVLQKSFGPQCAVRCKALAGHLAPERSPQPAPSLPRPIGQGGAVHLKVDVNTESPGAGVTYFKKRLGDVSSGDLTAGEFCTLQHNQDVWVQENLREPMQAHVRVTLSSALALCPWAGVGQVGYIWGPHFRIMAP